MVDPFRCGSISKMTHSNASILSGGGYSAVAGPAFTHLRWQVIINIENTTRVPVGDDLSYNEWFLKRI